MARGRSELSEGHIVRLDFGVPSGSEADVLGQVETVDLRRIREVPSLLLDTAV